MTAVAHNSQKWSLFVLTLFVLFMSLSCSISAADWMEVGQSKTITVTCSDPNNDDNGLSKCEVTEPCSHSCSASGNSGTCSCTFTPASTGSYQRCGRAVDEGKGGSNKLTDMACFEDINVCEDQCSFDDTRCFDDNTKEDCVDTDADPCREISKTNCGGDKCCLNGKCEADGYCAGNKVCSGGNWIDHCGDDSCNCGEAPSSCSEDCNDPVSGSLAAESDHVATGEPIKLTISASDLNGLASVRVYYDGSWHYQSCSGTSCSRTFTLTESQPGNYQYQGSVRGTKPDGDSESSGTSPNKVTVKVDQCDKDADCPTDTDCGGFTSTCDETGNYTDYYCQNPGSKTSRCQSKIETCSRDTDDDDCDDGQWCTVNDHCTSGDCQGEARSCSDGDSCTEDSCNETSDHCLHDFICSGNECCLNGNCKSEGTCMDSQICSGGGWIDHCGDDSCNCGENVTSCPEDCPVEITEAAVSDSCPEANNFTFVECTVQPKDIPCVKASLDGEACDLVGWEGNQARFNCSVGSYTTESCHVGGHDTATCQVDTDLCHQQGNDKSAEVYTLPSSCGSYGSSSTCTGNPDLDCEWCANCQGNQTSQYLSSLCVEDGANTCDYGCDRGVCGAECDGSDLGGKDCTDFKNPSGNYFFDGDLSCDTNSCTFNTSDCCNHACGFTGQRCLDSDTIEHCIDNDGDGCKEYWQVDCQSDEHCNKTLARCLPNSPCSSIQLRIDDGELYTNSSYVTLFVDNTNAGTSKCAYKNLTKTWTNWRNCGSCTDFTESNWELRHASQGLKEVRVVENDNNCWDQDTIVFDNLKPQITCNDCYQQLLNNVTFSLQVTDPDAAGASTTHYPSGVTRVDVCKDEQCSEIYCTDYSPSGGQAQCTRSWQNQCHYLNDVPFWIRARDAAGNVNTEQGGVFSLKRNNGCACGSDLECLSGWCYGEPLRVCSSQLAPRIYID